MFQMPYSEKWTYYYVKTLLPNPNEIKVQTESQKKSARQKEIVQFQFSIWKGGSC